MRQRCATHFKEKSTTKKTLFYIMNITVGLRIEKRRPRVCGDDVIRVTLADKGSDATHGGHISALAWS
jgi:hypothetical protein